MCLRVGTAGAERAKGRKEGQVRKVMPGQMRSGPTAHCVCFLLSIESNGEPLQCFEQRNNMSNLNFKEDHPDCCVQNQGRSREYREKAISVNAGKR